jgi:hypothetical protein
VSVSETGAVAVAAAGDGADQHVGTAAEHEVGAEGQQPVAGRPSRLRRLRTDLLVALGYLLGGLWVTAHLWTDINHRVLSSFPPDQYQFEFWLAHTARVFTHGGDLLFTDRLNYPTGVNMMANTGTFGMTIPLVPVTLLFGPVVSFAAMATMAPFLTALGWYLLFSRRLVRFRPAAAIAGAFCGFAPGIVAQDNVHPNLAMQLAVPLIVWQVLRMRDRDVAPWKPGLLLGLLVVYQFFINEEILLFTALGCLVFVLAWAAFNRVEARRAAGRLLVGLITGGALALALLAYPMWYQFLGPQHYHGFGDLATLFGADLLSFTAYPTYSLVTGQDSALLANNVVEETTFFGWPLVVLAFAWAAMLWRRTEVRAAVVTAIAFTVASLGDQFHVAGKARDVPAPWSLISDLPLFDSVIPSRFTLALVPLLGMLIALTVDRLLAQPTTGARAGLRTVLLAGLAIALVPIIPMPFDVVGRDPVPPFVTSGQWRSYVPPGHSMALVPIPTGKTGITAMQWSAAVRAEIPLAGGYFAGPNPQDPKMGGMFGPPLRPIITMFYEIVDTGKVPTVTEEDRRHAIEDLRAWRVSVVVLSPYEPSGKIMRQTMTKLLGFEPRFTGGVWLWDIRTLVSQA